MSITSLIPIFTSSVGSAASSAAPDVTALVPSVMDVVTNVGSTVVSGASEMAFSAVSGFLGAMFAVWRAKRSMNKHDYSDDETYIKEFFFERTDRINPDTGKNIHIFKLRPHEQIDLEKVFGQSIRSEVASKIIKAAEQCTAEKPVVFEFLRSVYDRKKWVQSVIDHSTHLTKMFDQADKINLLIENVDEHWTNFFGALATPESTMLRRLPKFSAPDEVTRFPILVYENEPKKRFHIFWLNEDHLSSDYFPDDCDIELEKDSEASYLPLIRAMVAQMRDPENAFIRDICRVPVPHEDVRHIGYLSGLAANTP